MISFNFSKNKKRKEKELGVLLMHLLCNQKNNGLLTAVLSTALVHNPFALPLILVKSSARIKTLIHKLYKQHYSILLTFKNLKHHERSPVNNDLMDFKVTVLH